MLDGSIPASKLVKIALERPPPSGDTFDAAAADRVIRFIELLPHIKGELAGSPLVLAPWQCWVTSQVFGWRRPDGSRRFRRVYLECPRKSGKSTWTAGLMLYMLCADGEAGAEVYCGATSEKQAGFVFDPAREMARRSPELVKHYGLTVGVKNLSIEASASFCRPVVHDPGDGQNVHFGVLDEVHEHPDSRLYDSFVTSTGARTQPLLWLITTAGDNQTGPCYAIRSEVGEVLEGKVTDDELFGAVYSIDPDDDWTDPASVEKANPSIGISVGKDFLLSAQAQAVANPRKAPAFRTRHLCQWITASSPYLDSLKWGTLGGANEAEYEGTECTIGLDLGARLDLCASLRVHKDGERYIAFPRLYLPEARIEDPDKRHYYEWAQNGWLTLTPGDVTDYDFIERDIKSDAERFTILRVCADPWNATQLTTHLQGHLGDDKVITIPQTVMHLSEPMKALEAAIVAGNIQHDGNPALAWCVGNLTAREDHNGNVFPRKPDRSPEKKIDGAVALVMALIGWMRQAAAPPKPKIRWLL